MFLYKLVLNVEGLIFNANSIIKHSTLKIKDSTLKSKTKVQEANLGFSIGIKKKCVT
jgi:hypothetical protein